MDAELHVESVTPKPIGYQFSAHRERDSERLAGLGRRLQERWLKRQADVAFGPVRAYQQRRPEFRDWFVLLEWDIAYLPAGYGKQDVGR